MTTTNKRQRNTDQPSAAAPTANTTTQSTDQSKKAVQTGTLIAKGMVGTKLESLARHVESLPKQLAMVIERQASSMLELVQEIDQRTTAVDRFDHQVTNPLTKAKEPFAPSCCRLKNPMSASRLLQDEDAYKAVVSGYDELIKEFQDKARTLLQNSAKLEVSIRKDLLGKKILESIRRLAVNFSAQEFIKNGFATNKVIYTLTDQEIAYQAAYE